MELVICLIGLIGGGYCTVLALKEAIYLFTGKDKILGKDNFLGVGELILAIIFMLLAFCSLIVFLKYILGL